MKKALLIFVVTILINQLAFGHDPKMHDLDAEAPNCDAITEMDHFESETDDPVMRAIMAKCRNEKTEVETLEGMPLELSNKPYREQIGHDAPMLESAPPHDRSNHRKVYEVADCENMSNMYHSSLDSMDPVLQDLMKQCEKTDEEEGVNADDSEQTDD